MMRSSGSGLGRRLGWAESSGPPGGSRHLNLGDEVAETAHCERAERDYYYYYLT